MLVQLLRYCVIGFLMDEFKKLEEIGLKEISNRTHIEIKILEQMINSQFEKLNRATTVGFVKILSREYGLDLEEWLNEAERFWSKNRVEDNNPKIFIVQKSKNSLKIVMALIAILALIGILYGAYIFLNKKINIFDKSVVKNDKNFTYEETPVVNEAKGMLEKNISDKDLNNTVVAQVNQTTDLNFTTINEQNSSDVNNSSASVKSLDINSSKDLQVKSDTIANVDEDYISPKSKLWVGVIYLDNFKRGSFIGTKNFELNASRDQLITTGHGNFVLQFNGETKRFKSQKSIKLLVKDGNISVISNEKFKELNRGSLW